MSEYSNENRGVLFKNDRKESERHPDYKGQVNVGGQEFWLSAWIKEGRNGKYMSLSVQPKEPRGNTDAQRDNYSQNYRPSDQGGGFGGGGPEADDIPFMPEWRV
jgi:hypothetical protein